MAVLERLAGYGAIELAAHEARTTSLGDYGVVERLRRGGQPVKVVTDAAEMSAAELLSVLADMRTADIAALGADWFGSRESLDGARELLDTCASPEAYVARCAAVKLVSDLGASAVPVWQERLGHPTLGAWARQALIELGEDLPDPTDKDRALDFWMGLDRWGLLIEQGRPDEIVNRFAKFTGVEEDLMEVIWRLDHPVSADALAAIAAHTDDKKTAKAARRAIFKLRSARGKGPHPK
jgi:hypothetical protein